MARKLESLKGDRMDKEQTERLIKAIERIGDILEHMVMEGLIVMPDVPASDN